MRTLARPIGLGLAARGDIEDVVGWSRRARDAGLEFGVGPRLVLRARRGQLLLGGRLGDRRGWRQEPGRGRGRLPGRPRRGQPVHPPSGRPRDDRLGARRDAAGPDRHGPGHRPAPAAQADGHPVRPGLGRRGRVEGDGPDPGALGGRAPAVRDARPAADPADVPADPPDPARHRRVPQGVRGAGRPEGGRLPRPPGRIDPEPDRHPGAPRRGRRGGGPRPGVDRDGRIPAVARRCDAARGAQPGEARAVRHLHDVGAVRRLPRPCGLRGRPARPDRRRLAGRGLHDRRQPHPGRAARRVHAVRDARGRRGQGDGVPREGRTGAAPPPAGGPGRPPGRRADRGGGDVRGAPGGVVDRVAAGSDAPAEVGGDDRPAEGLADDRRLGLGGLLRRRAGGVWEILRPFAYTASVVPIVAGGALAAVDQHFEWLPFLAALLGGVLLHSARTWSTRSTTSARASTRSPVPGPATPSSRAG